MYSDQESSDFFADLGKDGSLDLTKLTEWAQKSHLDPNDPSNASFFFLIKVLVCILYIFSFVLTFFTHPLTSYFFSFRISVQT